MEITIEEFKKTYLPPILEMFQVNTQNSLIHNQAAIHRQLRKQLSSFVDFANTFQKKIPIEIGEIQIALLQTSVYFHKPQIGISAYDELGVFGNEIFQIKYDVSWLFTAWDDFKRKLDDQIFALHAENYIRPEAVRQMMFDSLPFLINSFCIFSKYQLRDFDRIMGYETLKLAENFKLSIGSYRDWTKTLYRKRPELDIFFHDADIPLRYCRFHDAVYRKKHFSRLDLQYTRFTDCEFVHCDFEDVELQDVVFIHCRMYHCTFKNINVSGATFEEVTIKKCNFTNSIWNGEPDMEHMGAIPDFYKNAELIDCELEAVHFEQSDLRDIVQRGSSFKQITIQDCRNDETVLRQEV